MHLEDKRRRHRPALPDVRAGWRACDTRPRTDARLAGYELQPGNLVLEFKPAGMDKGKAVRELLLQAPFAGRKPVYLGDDLTDEHAFTKINRADGMSVRVGDRAPALAHFTLPTPPRRSPGFNTSWTP